MSAPDPCHDIVDFDSKVIFQLGLENLGRVVIVAGLVELDHTLDPSQRDELADEATGQGVEGWVRKMALLAIVLARITASGRMAVTAEVLRKPFLEEGIGAVEGSGVCVDELMDDEWTGREDFSVDGASSCKLVTAGTGDPARLPVVPDARRVVAPKSSRDQPTHVV